MTRFIGRTEVYRPGLELITEVELSPLADPYLSHHRLGQEFLFPAVMGLEAMAQVAGTLLGASGPFEFEDVEFLRHIVVGDRTMTIRIAGLRSGGDVRVAIRCAGTGFESDHLTGVVRLTTAARPDQVAVAAQNLALAAPNLARPDDVLTDVRAGAGDRCPDSKFRAVEVYLHIGAQRCSARLAGRSTRWFAPALPQLQVLGAPELRESMVRSVRVCVPDRLLSPTRMRRFLVASPLAETATMTIAAVELEHEGNRYVYEVAAIDETGAVVAAIEGLEFTAVRPAAQPDAWPPELTGPLLQRQLLRLLPHRLDVAVVRICVEHADGPRGRRVPGRREASRRALSLATGRSVDLRYRADGRPELADGAMSMSHTESMTLAVACALPVGCDMEEVRERTFDAWKDLLGMSGVALAEMVSTATSEPFGHAATRVWSAREAVSKLGVTVLRPRLVLEPEVVDDGWLALRHGSDLVWTKMMSVDDGRGPRPIVFAFAQKG